MQSEEILFQKKKIHEDLTDAYNNKNAAPLW